MKYVVALLGIALTFTGCGSDSDDNGGGGATGGAAGAGGSAGAGGIQVGTEITIADGIVTGAVEGAARAFRGIPYAKPPLGELRFKPPRPAEPWTTPLDATKSAAKCPQIGTLGSTGYQGEEDCLTLDVWTPEPAPTAARPVMVWIHGGSFTSGSGTETLYEGGNVVPQGDVVLVTVNYRLGPLGFAAHQALTAEDPAYKSSGNYGLEDQRLALEWVKKNISAFGGDPNNVTLFGESAGGISVCSHLTSPGSAGLFHRAILESGPCGSSVDDLATAEKQGDDLAQALGCTDAAAVLTCLRGKTAEEIINALPLSAGFLAAGGVGWGPVIDGLFLPGQPATRLQSGQHNAVPAIIGANADEGDLFVFGANLTNITETQYANLINLLGPSVGATASDVLTRYPAANYATPSAALSAVVGDVAFVCPARRNVRAIVDNGGDAYLYHFQRPITLLGVTKAIHGAELPFVFGNELLGFKPEGPDAELSSQMIGYWTRFATTADPNGGSSVAWPKYTTAADPHLILDTTIVAGTALKQADCDYWDTVTGP